jgi:hypothetical protein
MFMLEAIESSVRFLKCGLTDGLFDGLDLAEAS